MNRELISKAIGNVDDVYIAQTMSPPATGYDHAPERTIKMNEYKHKRRGAGSRRLLSLALAACLAFALAAAAYAFDLFGIRELFRTSFRELPDEADAYIQRHTEAASAGDWSAEIIESLCDTSTVMVTVRVSGGDKYILAPTDAMGSYSVRIIGLEGSQTLEAYAQEQGKELLFIGAAINDSDALGLINGSQTHKSISDSEMVILIQTHKNGSVPTTDAVCSVYVKDEDGAVSSLELPFTLTEAAAKEVQRYVPDAPDAVPGLIAGEATVTETPLGVNIRFMETVTDEELFGNIRIELEGFEYWEGGSVLEDDGNWYFTVSMAQGTVSDSFTVHFYDQDKRSLGVIEFHKQ